MRRSVGKDCLDATTLEPDRRTGVSPRRRPRCDRVLEFRRERRTADLQRPARVADQGVDRRVHQGDRHQGDLPPGRRHRARQPARRRGRRIARRRLPDRELPRHGRRRDAPDCSPTSTPTPSTRFRRNTVRPPASGPASPRARTVFVYNKTKLQPDQLPKSMLDLRAARVEGPLGRGAGQGGLPGHRLRAASAQGRAGHRAVAGRHEDQRQASTTTTSPP